MFDKINNVWFNTSIVNLKENKMFTKFSDDRMFDDTKFLVGKFVSF